MAVEIPREPLQFCMQLFVEVDRHSAIIGRSLCNVEEKYSKSKRQRSSVGANDIFI